MAQNVTVAGASYSDVPSVVLPKTGGGSAEFLDTTISTNAATASDILAGKFAYVNGSLIEGTGTGGGTAAITIDDTTDSAGGTVRTITALDISDTTAVAADVAQGKYFYTSNGTKTAGSATIGSNTFVVTLSWDDDYFGQDEGAWVPDATFAEIQAAYAAEKNIVTEADPATADAQDVQVSGIYDDAEETYAYYVQVYNSDITVWNAYVLASDGTITSDSETSYYTNSLDAESADVKAGILFIGANGRDTGTATVRTSSDLSASGATVTAPAGFYSSAATKTIASGSVTAPSTITGTSATVSPGTNALTLSKTVSVTPNVTTAGYISSGTAGNASVSLTASVTTKASQTIHPSLSDQTIASGTYLTGTQTIKGVSLTNFSSENIKSGVTVKIGDSTDDDCVTAITGTYSGGTSKNTQIVQSTTRTNSSSMTALSAELTVAKTGTYDIYYSATRTNTSSSYTWATQLYKDGTAQGTENTTWSNNVQNVHLTNQSLTANQKLRVYGRHTRGSSYYVCAPMLAIVES